MPLLNPAKRWDRKAVEAGGKNMGKLQEIYINLKKDFLTRTKQSANKKAIDELGEEEGINSLLYPELPAKVEIEEITEHSLLLSVSSELGFFSIDVELGQEELIELISIAVKKLNKFKGILESLK